jgi:hypothetical protein
MFKSWRDKTMKPRILIGCECSGTVRDAFRSQGFDAFSCDLQPDKNNSPYHKQETILNVMYEGWDLFIAHPPCTFLLVAGARWMYDERYPNRRADQDSAAEFFMQCVNAPIDRIAIENPVGVMSTHYRKPDQIIQPYEFGHNAVKKTCLWLKNLPCLIPKYYEITNEKDPYFIHNMARSADRGQKRSVTFSNIALAMVDQWGKLL